MITLGRNEPCHCGSGKKYKKCHLAQDEAKQSKELQKLSFAAAPAGEAEKKKNEHGGSKKPEKNWLKNVAGKMGFHRSAAPRKAPSGGGSGG